MNVIDQQYAESLAAVRHSITKHHGVLYVISHRRSKRVIHVTTTISVARSLLDQEYNQLRMTKNNRDGLPQGFDPVQPWFCVCSREARLSMSDAPAADSVDYQLLSARYWTMELLYQQIRKHHVACLLGDLPHQQRIYDTKAVQAARVLGGQTDFFSTYHVHDWAEIRGIELLAAAAEIVFQHEEADLALAQIERLRLRFQQRIKTAASTDKLAEIMNDFQHESATYAQV